MQINYKSDFKLVESGLESDVTTPFRFTYKTDAISSYVAEFDGEEYTNCQRLEDGTLLVIFDNHRLGVGHLRVEREWFLTDDTFTRDNYTVVADQKLDVVLGSAQTESSTISVEVTLPYKASEGGISVYAQALLNGYEGTEEEWFRELNSSLVAEEFSQADFSTLTF